MGQGTDSVDGWGVEYNPYEEGLAQGIWTMRDHSTVHIDNMSDRHIRNARKYAKIAALNSTFTSEAEVFEGWLQLFDDELMFRAGSRSEPVVKKTKTKQRGSKVLMLCHCGEKYHARTADIKRGWALSCSKSCAAIRRDFGRNPAKQIQ